MAPGALTLDFHVCSDYGEADRREMTHGGDSLFLAVPGGGGWGATRGHTGEHQGGPGAGSGPAGVGGSMASAQVCPARQVPG